MKKIFALLLAVVFALSLASCNNGSNASDSENDVLSTSIYTLQGVSIPLPADFTVDESASPVAAYHKDYPSVGDNINFIYSESETINSYTEENINKTYKDYFDDFSGIEEYEQYKINGKNAIKFLYTIKLDDSKMKQTQIICETENGVVAVTYTNISGDFVDAFEASMKAITISD